MAASSQLMFLCSSPTKTSTLFSSNGSGRRMAGQYGVAAWAASPKKTQKKKKKVFLIESKARSKEGESPSEEDSEAGNLGIVAIASGLVSNPVIGWSLYTLKTTGCGLPPGPGGSIGALEGISYLVVVAIVFWSALTKIRTGKGLPNGPFALLGAVEGLSYLALVAIVVVFALQFLDKGFIPGPLPGEQCYG